MRISDWSSDVCSSDLKALAALIDGGFLAASFPESEGGLQLPYTLTSATMAWFTAANAGTTGYAFLTTAAANLLRVHGTPEQKVRYMQPMLAGRWFGTMRSEERRVGKEWVRTCRCRGWPEH